MSFRKRILRQRAVYWPVVGRDGQGKPTWGDPIIIKCRWDDMTQNYLNGKGELKVSNAEVMVDQPIEEDSVLFLVPKEDQKDFALSTLSYLHEPLRNKGAYLVSKSENTPNIRATEFFRTVTL